MGPCATNSIARAITQSRDTTHGVVAFFLFLVSLDNVDGCVAMEPITIIKLSVNAWATEVSWTIKGTSGSCSGGNYTNNIIYTIEDCIMGDGTYTLSCMDSFGDGWHGGSLKINEVVYCDKFLQGSLLEEVFTIASSENLNSSPHAFVSPW